MTLLVSICRFLATLTWRWKLRFLWISRRLGDVEDMKYAIVAWFILLPGRLAACIGRLFVIQNNFRFGHLNKTELVDFLREKSLHKFATMNGVKSWLCALKILVCFINDLLLGCVTMHCSFLCLTCYWVFTEEVTWWLNKYPCGVKLFTVILVSFKWDVRHVCIIDKLVGL